MKKLGILLLALIMVVGSVGCGAKTKDKEPTKKEVVQIEETVEQEDSTLTNDTIEETTVNSEDSNENQDLDNKNESTSNKNETTTKPSTGNTDSNKKPSTGSTTKPSTGSTNNSGNTGNTQNNSTSTTTQPSTPAHTHSWTEVKETVVVQEAWVEDVYGWRTICGKCGLDMTEMTGEELIIHCSFECNSRYSAKYIKYDEIQHPAVTEERVTGYKCSCGATKKK